MNFQNDVNEMIAFINSDNLESASSYDNALQNITINIEEDFLQERADYITNVIGSDASFKEALKKVEGLCRTNMCEICPINKFCNRYIKEARQKADASSLQMIDLFCGAGGLSLGFKQEGFVTALANDIEECCVDTYAHNHPETPRKYIVKGDIREVIDHLEDLTRGRKIDIVVGGPPCQGFSMANRQRLIDDPRNHLYKNYVEIVKRVQPKFFVMENVKGMLSVAEQVKEEFRNIGYEVECHVLNAKDYGVPQNRERLIYIGNRVGIDNSKIFEEIFSLADSISSYTLGDALYGLRKLEASRKKNSTEIGSELSGFKIERNQCETMNDYIEFINQGRRSNIIANHKARYNNDRDIEIFGRLYQGDKSDDPKIADIMPYASRNDIFKDKYFKLEENKICRTITAHMKFD